MKCIRCARTDGTKCLKHDKTYNAWCNLKARCLNPKNARYSRYGGRGITVCDRWRNSFSNFLADMGESPPGLTIDRINNDGNYEPGNCRWIPAAEQAKNKSRKAKPRRMTDLRATRFTIESAANVRAMLDCEMSVRSVARTYRTSTSHIRAIRDGMIWKP